MRFFTLPQPPPIILHFLSPNLTTEIQPWACDTSSTVYFSFDDDYKPINIYSNNNNKSGYQIFFLNLHNSPFNYNSHVLTYNSISTVFVRLRISLEMKNITCKFSAFLTLSSQLSHSFRLMGETFNWIYKTVNFNLISETVIMTSLAYSKNSREEKGNK